MSPNDAGGPEGASTSSGTACIEVDRNSLTVAAIREFESNRFALIGQDGPTPVAGPPAIALSGRIFNRAKLSRILDADPRDQSALLLCAYRKWGVDFLSHVEGEFALSLWDSAARRLLLARDTTGYWPLLYTHCGKDFVFASDIRQILSWPKVKARLNEARVAQWLGLAFEPTSDTFFDGIFSVRPGSALVFDAGRISEDFFWHPEQTPLLRLADPRDYAEGLIAVIDRAVKDRLPAKGSAGSQLSGGLDSSTVTATAARLLAEDGRRLAAFTAVPAHAVADVEGRFTDEGPYAAAVAAMYPNIDHVMVRHGAHPIIPIIDRFATAQEEPVFNPMNYDWILESCLRARDRGLDSLLIAFFGNNSISQDGSGALRALMLQGRFLALARLASDMHRTGSRRWRGVIHELVRPWLPTQLRRGLDRMRGRASAVHEYSFIRPEFRNRHGIGLMAIEQKLIGLDNSALRLFLLRRQDLGSTMRAFRNVTGIAMTDPTADRRVIEYCLSVPIEQFCRDGVPRSLIRDATAGRLPDKVRVERRRGLQSADIGRNFESERAEAAAEITRLKQVELAARALNLEAMEASLRWSRSQIDAFDETLYWVRLLRALSLGRYLRRFEDGSLLAMPRPPGD